jgi:long-subunit acyl-CoA synthetase (AMP-forming)
MHTSIGSMLLANQACRESANAFAQKELGIYRYWSWQALVDDVLSFAGFLHRLQLNQDSGQVARIALISTNGYQRLVSELAVMSSGFISVPIFSGYAPELTAELLQFTEADLLITDNLDKVSQLPATVVPEMIVHLNASNSGEHEVSLQAGQRVISFTEALEKHRRNGDLIDQMRQGFEALEPDTQAMIMYTSGTSSFPKGVQLSHRNLMSQQQALKQLWQPEPGMRFLCYLPWHHSFGGLFERLFALSSGGCLAVDDSAGKDVDRLLENFSEIRPHIYLSVPKVYQEIVARVLKDPELVERFFHPELKFVFTAAAPLPLSTSDVFKARGVPVVEGWGLTECSPCCTLTELSLDRSPGVVGWPIPGVEIALAEDNEILIKGPNVMSGYFKNPEATAAVAGEDGWFKTGDVGELTTAGVKIVSRKDRVFKLSNGEKIYPARIEEYLYNRCKFIKHAYVFGAGRSNPCLLVFPNNDLFDADRNADLDGSGCHYPNCTEGLSECLCQCIDEVQSKHGIAVEQLDTAIIVDRELTLERNELTPSFKLIPRRIEQNYARYINCPRTLTSSKCRPVER